MYEGTFKELKRGWLRTGPSLLEIGSDPKAWTGFRRLLASDHQRTLFDMWLDKCDGRRLPERSDFSHRETLPMMKSFYTLDYDFATKIEVHRYIGSAYADAVGYELTGGDFEQAHYDQLGYDEKEHSWLARDIHERGCPCLERYQFSGFDRPHNGSIDLTLPVRRPGSDDLGEAVGVGFLYDAANAPPSEQGTENASGTVEN